MVSASRTAGACRGAASGRAASPARGQRRASSAYAGRSTPSARRRRVPAKLRLLISVAVLALAIFGLTRLLGSGGGEDRFVENVYINGISLAGYTRDEGYAMMAEIKERSLNTTYALTYGGRTWSFTPADFDAQIDFDSELERAWNLGHVGDKATRRQIVNGLKDVPAEFNAELTYDESALKTFIAGLAEEINTEPVDAQVTLTETKPVITQASVNGLKLNLEKTRENLEQLITTGEGETALPVEEVQPSIASDNMEMSVIAKFATDVSFRNSDSRYNVRLALNKFDLMAVYDGDLVDFNAVVGPRTEEAGFRKAPEYAGNSLQEGVGGGVCQASTTLYNALIMADMTIIERRPHNMTVSYVEPSQDAAVEYGGKNLVFQNNSGHTIYIYTEVGSEKATVTIYGTRPAYHYVLESVMISQRETELKRYQYDYSGKYVYYVTDPPKLEIEGRGSCQSEGWIVAYDWDTKQEVSREQRSYDDYSQGYSVYWRGVHDMDGNIVVEG